MAKTGMEKRLVLYTEHFRKVFLIIILLCSHLIIPVRSDGRSAPQHYLTAKAAILMDAATGEVLFEKNADVPLPPASTTKVMTALVALEQNSLNAVMEARKDATLAPSLKIGIHEGERWPLYALLHCILLKSANDASLVIAEGTAGSVEQFAALMNRKAAAIGARHTNFMNPHGLDEEGHYTTARDMALIFQHAGRQPVFRRIAGTKAISINSPNARPVALKNHNRLLETYPGMLYGKTGYTSQAKRCFVGMASRNGRELIVCVLGSRNHFQDAARLLDYGFGDEMEVRPVRLEAGVSSVDTRLLSAAREYLIQTASFSDYARALDLHAELTARGYPAFIKTVFLDNRQTWYRVKVGYYTDLKSALHTRERIKRDFNLHPLIEQ